MSTNYGYVVVRKLAFADIGDAARHARGDDADHRRRDDAGEARAVVAWPDHDGGEWRIDIARRHCRHQANDYHALFKAHKKRHQAQEYGHYPPIRHLIVGVSPAAIGGDGHDPHDKQLRRLLWAAVDWAEEEFGGVFAARADVDEKGQGEIDVLIAPVRDVQCGRAKSRKPKIVPGRALEEFAQRNRRGAKRSYSLMQDSWVEFVRGRGFDVARGRPKKETGKEHLSPEDYGEAKDAARNQAEHNRRQLAAIAAEGEDLARRVAACKRREAACAETEAANAKEARKLAADREAVARREDEAAANMAAAKKLRAEVLAGCERREAACERREAACAEAEAANAKAAAAVTKQRDEVLADRQCIMATRKILERGFSAESLMRDMLDIAYSRFSGASEARGRDLAARHMIDYDSGEPANHPMGRQPSRAPAPAKERGRRSPMRR